MCRPARPEPGREIVIARLIGEHPEQLEHLGERRIGRNGDLLYRVKLDPLQQGLGIYRRGVDEQLPVLRRDRHTLDLEHGNQRAELRLLALFRPRIAKQLERARDRRGEVLRGGHGEAESIEYAP